MKKLLLLILTINMGVIQAQYTLIPDTNFEQALIDQCIDSEGILDGQVLTADISAITDLSVNSRNIADLTGIADFTALEYLNVTYNNLNVLDLSGNVNLITLLAYVNSLATIDLPLNIEDAHLYINNLIDIDFSNYIALKDLRINDNPLESVNLENAIALERLDLYGIDANLGDNLNISNCTHLKTLYASATLTSIDLSTNIALEIFGGGPLQGGETDLLIEIDFSNNPNLYSFAYINAGLNPLERINFNNGNNAVLTNVSIYYAEVACVQVDDAIAANNGTGVYANWQVPSSQEFSADCFTIGIEEAITQSISIFPNPTASFVTVNIPDNEIKGIKLFNQLGEQVAFFKTNSFTISHLTKGVYFVKIINKDNSIYIAKILKL